MFATDFEQSNTVFDKPKEMSREECSALNVWCGLNLQKESIIISCWKPTKEELEEINKTGRVWCIHYGSGLQPHALLGVNPFD